MSESNSDPSISGELSRLVQTLEDLQRELEPGDRRALRPPSPDEIRRFTSEVTVPALILVLETNVRALKLVQRALRLADEESGDRSGRRTRPVHREATDLTREALTRLDDVLRDVDDAIAGEPTDDEARDLLQQARDLQTSIDDLLAHPDGEPSDRRPSDDDRQGTVPVDVDAELQAIKDQIGSGSDDGSDGERTDPSDGGSDDDDTERP